MIDYYEILGMRVESTFDEIKNAYRKKAFDIHPDRNSEEKYYEEIFKELSEANSVLSNPEKRAEYDELYKNRLDFLAKQAKNPTGLPDEKFPHHIKGFYLKRIRENNDELAKLYYEAKIVDEVIYKSYAFSLFQNYCQFAPEFSEWEKEIRFLRESLLKPALETFKLPLHALSPIQDEFSETYMQELLEKQKVTEKNRFLFRGLLLSEERRNKYINIIILEYDNIVLNYSSFLNEKANEKSSQVSENIRQLSELLKFLKTQPHSQVKSENIWKIVMSVFPFDDSPTGQEMLSSFKEHSTQEKIDNLILVNEFIDFVISLKDYSMLSVIGFAHVINRLNLYCERDIMAIKKLNDLKYIFFDFYSTTLSVLDEKGDDNEIGAMALGVNGSILNNDTMLKPKIDLVLKNYANSEKSGCFIATACYGDFNAPEVLILRKYRDLVLKKNLTGMAFIKLYYFISPTMASFLKKNHTVRKIIKQKFLDKVVSKITKILG